MYFEEYLDHDWLPVHEGALGLGCNPIQPNLDGESKTLNFSCKKLQIAKCFAALFSE